MSTRGKQSTTEFEPESRKGRKNCEIAKCLLLSHRAKVFRGKKVLGDYDIKVEQVLLGFYSVTYGRVDSILLSFLFFNTFFFLNSGTEVKVT